MNMHSEPARPPADALRETWEGIERQSFQLAAMACEYAQDSDRRFDALVMLPRGGYFPALVISRCLGFEAIQILQASIGSYQDGATQRRGDFKTGQMPTEADVKGKHLLIIDEVCDTGETLAYLVKQLQSMGAASIKTGVLHYKPGRSTSGFKPDWFITKTDKWIVYPWEAYHPNMSCRTQPVG